MQQPVLLQARNILRLFLGFLEINFEYLRIAARFEDLGLILDRGNLQQFRSRRLGGLDFAGYRLLGPGLIMAVFWRRSSCFGFAADTGDNQLRPLGLRGCRRRLRRYGRRV